MAEFFIYIFFNNSAFWSQHSPDDAGGCWPWPGSFNNLPERSFVYLSRSSFCVPSHEWMKVQTRQWAASSLAEVYIFTQISAEDVVLQALPATSQWSLTQKESRITMIRWNVWHLAWGSNSEWQCGSFVKVNSDTSELLVGKYRTYLAEKAKCYFPWNC